MKFYTRLERANKRLKEKQEQLVYERWVRLVRQAYAREQHRIEVEKLQESVTKSGLFAERLRLTKGKDSR